MYNQKTRSSVLSGSGCFHRFTIGGAVAAAIGVIAPIGTAIADDPFFVVPVAGQTVCSDFTEPQLSGPQVRINNDGTFSVSVLDSTVLITIRGAQTFLDFVVESGNARVDGLIIKGSSGATLYLYANGLFDEGLTTALTQKIQNVAVCSSGEQFEIPNVPLPSCNVADNRDEEDQCTQTDIDQSTVAIKVATEGPNRGETFFCQCGNAELEVTDVLENVDIDFEKFTGPTFLTVNPTCLKWEKIGGKTVCTASF